MKSWCTKATLLAALAILTIPTAFSKAPSQAQMTPIIDRLVAAPGAATLSDLYLAGYSPAEVLEGIKATLPGLLVVEFSSTDFCPPCRRFKPIFEETAHRLRSINNNGRTVPIVYIEIDGKYTEKSLFSAAQRALGVSVRSIPCVYFFAFGSRRSSIDGYEPRFSAIVEQQANNL